MEYSIEITGLSHDNLVNLFSTGLYSNYALSADYPHDIDYDDSYYFEDKIAHALLQRKSITLYDEYDNSKPYKITYKDILKACSNKEGGKYALELFKDEDGDMFTAWNILQIAMFGKVIYG